MATEEPTERSSYLRRHSGPVVVVLAVVLALTVTAVLGGLATAESDGPEAVAPGTELTATPFRVRLDRAYAAYEVSGRPAEPGQAYLVVRGVLSLATSEAASAHTLGDVFVADLASGYDLSGNPTDEPAARIVVADDGSALQGLGPGLTYDVGLIYVVDEGDVPERLTMTVNEHVRRRSSLDDSLGWFDPAPAARVTLDVAPLPDERPEPEGF